MRVVAFISQCAKSGRTTLASNLAVQAMRAGAGPVSIVDAVPNGALAAWSTQRGARSPNTTTVAPDRLGDHLAHARSCGTSFAFIDTSPATDTDLTAIIALADLVIIRVSASGDDTCAVGATVELVERADKPFVFVVNYGEPGQPLTVATALALAQHGTLCPVALARDPAFARCLASGTALTETDEAVAADVVALWNYVRDRAVSLEDTSAPVVAPRPSEDRRILPRFDLTWEVVLIRDGVRSTYRLNNISGGGVSIDTTEPFAAGDQVCIEIPHFGQLDARVVYVRGGQARMEFVAVSQTRSRIGTVAKRRKELSNIIGQGRKSVATEFTSLANAPRLSDFRSDMPRAS